MHFLISAAILHIKMLTAPHVKHLMKANQVRGSILWIPRFRLQQHANLVHQIDLGYRTFQPRTFQPQASTLDFSTPRHFNHELLNPRPLWGWKVHGWMLRGWNVQTLIAAYNSRHGEKCLPSYAFIIKKSRQIAVCNNLLWCNDAFDFISP